MKAVKIGDVYVGIVGKFAVIVHGEQSVSFYRRELGDVLKTLEGLKDGAGHYKMPAQVVGLPGDFSSGEWHAAVLGYLFILTRGEEIIKMSMSNMPQFIKAIQDLSGEEAKASLQAVPAPSAKPTVPKKRAQSAKPAVKAKPISTEDRVWQRAAEYIRGFQRAQGADRIWKHVRKGEGLQGLTLERLQKVLDARVEANELVKTGTGRFTFVGVKKAAA